MPPIPRVALLLIFLLSSITRVGAAGFKVAPARFIVHDVRPGVLYDIYKETGLRLTVYNDDDTTRSWVLSTYRPSERGAWEKGYAEIPDPQWCWFDRSEITIAPNAKAYAGLFLKIPDEEKYYNQHWIVTLGVEGKPGRGGIGLAVDVRAQIETQSKADLKTKPHGRLGIEPSTVWFENPTPGQCEKRCVILHNNDVKTHTYRIGSLFENNDKARKTYLTHSFRPMPSPGWLTWKKKIRVRPGESAAMALELRIPAEEAPLGGKWEEILLIQPDEGRAGFVRARVETEVKARGSGSKHPPRKPEK